MDKKKVGILTFHRAINYGAVLQAYALRHKITEYGFDCDIIDYYCPAIEDGNFRINVKGEKIKTKVKKLLTWPVQSCRNKKFTDFVRQYLLCDNAKRYSKDNIKECDNRYDYYIVGSDQVWSPLCTAGDTTYFLDFVSDSKKKNSYAASIGLAKENFFNPQICKLINDFNNISIRESSKVAYIQSLLTSPAKDVVCCVDPVFLLSQTQWDDIASPVKINDYVLVYSLALPKEVYAFAEKFAHDKKLKLIICTFNNLSSYLHGKETVIASPTEFLSYLKNAQYVMTNSFHGTAFSIIYNKNFITITNSNPNHDNSRLYNILDALGLLDRLQKYENIYWPSSNIDYVEVNNRLSYQVDESENYLKNIFVI